MPQGIFRGATISKLSLRRAPAPGLWLLFWVCTWCELQVVSLSRSSGRRIFQNRIFLFAGLTGAAFERSTADLAGQSRRMTTGSVCLLRCGRRIGLLDRLFHQLFVHRLPQATRVIPNQLRLFGVMHAANGIFTPRGPVGDWICRELNAPQKYFFQTIPGSR